MKNKFYIKMDEQALLNAGKNYDLERMYEVLDEMFIKAGFTKNEAVTDGSEYVDAEDFAKVCGVQWKLEKQEWFLPYCLVWTWVCQEEGEEDEVYDNLENLKEKG